MSLTETCFYSRLYGIHNVYEAWNTRSVPIWLCCNMGVQKPSEIVEIWSQAIPHSPTKALLCVKIHLYTSLSKIFSGHLMSNKGSSVIKYPKRWKKVWRWFQNFPIICSWVHPKLRIPSAKKYLRYQLSTLCCCVQRDSLLHSISTNTIPSIPSPLITLFPLTKFPLSGF